MIIPELISVIGRIVAIIAPIFTVIWYILTTKKTSVTLTFDNQKDKIGCKVGEDRVLHFLLRNAGNITAHNVEATVYYPEGLVPLTRDNTKPDEVEYFTDPERVVLRVKILPPKSSPVTRHTSSVKPDKVGTYELNYEITGEKVKRKTGKLFIEAER